MGLLKLESHALSLYPQTPSFNILMYSFDFSRNRVHLPHLELYFWFTSTYKSIHNKLGFFIKVDPNTSLFSHTSFTRILVDINLSKPLSSGISLKVGELQWRKFFNYKGTLLRCRRFFFMGHLSLSYPHGSHIQSFPTQWKVVDRNHLTIFLVLLDSNYFLMSKSPSTLLLQLLWLMKIHPLYVLLICTLFFKLLLGHPLVVISPSVMHVYNILLVHSGDLLSMVLIPYLVLDSLSLDY